MPEERIKAKLNALRESYTIRYKRIVCSVSLVLFVVFLLFFVFVGRASMEFSEFLVAIVKSVVVFVLCNHIITKALTSEFRCLNFRKCNFHKAYIRNKKFVKAYDEFVGVDNKRVMHSQKHYILLDNETHYTLAKSWAYFDVKENETYWLAFTGKKRTKRSIIVCAVKAEN